MFFVKRRLTVLIVPTLGLEKRSLGLIYPRPRSGFQGQGVPGNSVINISHAVVDVGGQGVPGNSVINFSHKAVDVACRFGESSVFG